MYCEKCGTKLGDDSLFCEVCGTKIEKEDDVMPASNPIQEPIYAAQPQQVSPAQSATLASPKRPMTKGLKLLLIEAAILVALCIAFFQIGAKHFSPETVANQYFMAKAKGDWNKVYESMDLPDSKMLTPEIFFQSVKDNDLIDITNYKVSEIKIGMPDEDSMIRTFECKYMPKGGSNMVTEELQLVQQQEKELLFFTQWKVSPSNNLAENCEITIPADATAFLNGINVEELAAKTERTNPGEKKYILPKAFPGNYSLKVQAPFRQEYLSEIPLLHSNSNWNIISDMELEANILESISGLCIDTIEQLFLSASNENEYDVFYAALKDNITEEFECPQLYNEIANNFIKKETSSYQYIWQSAALRNLDYGFQGDTYNSNGNLCMDIHTSLTYDYSGYESHVNWWTGEEENSPFNETDKTMNINFSLELKDGQWKLSQMY